MKLVVLGLSLSSAWGNGHATTYRTLLRGFASRGHDILFLERDVPWYAGKARDLVDPDFCRLVFYDSLAELQGHADAIASADAVMVGSYVPDGIAVGDFVLATAQGVTAFYDIDTPVTLAALDAGRCAYLQAKQISAYDVYFSFTGGPTLERLRRQYGARHPVALYCCADPHRETATAKAWDLSYLGTYSDDRQPVLDRLLLEPARRAPHLAFAVAGPQYPDNLVWPPNVERIAHVAPADHAAFYGASRFTLNVTRADMVKAGHSPSVRLFEAAACGTPVISDRWRGIEDVFTPGTSILIADTADDVLAVIGGLGGDRAARVAAAAYDEVAAAHTGRHRAAELERALHDAHPAARVQSLSEQEGWR